MLIQTGPGKFPRIVFFAQFSLIYYSPLIAATAAFRVHPCRLHPESISDFNPLPEFIQASLVNPPPVVIDLTAEESPDEFESVEQNNFSPPSTPGTPEPGNQDWAPYVKSEIHPDPEALSAALTRYLNNHLDRIRAEQRQSSLYPDWPAFLNLPPEQYPPPGYQPPGQS